MKGNKDTRIYMKKLKYRRKNHGQFKPFKINFGASRVYITRGLY